MIFRRRRLFSLVVTILAAFIVGCKDDTNVEKLLLVNKVSYYNCEDIYVTAQGEDNSWVGLYREVDNTNEKDPIYWYYVNKNGFTSGDTYSIQRSATLSDSRVAFKKLPKGNYKIILFDEHKNIITSKKFSISTEDVGVANIPTSMIYTLDNETDGLANGKITFTFDELTFNTTELVMYWANEEGKLDNYTSFAKIKSLYSTFDFVINNNLVIPTLATRLRVYAINTNGISEEYYEIELPKECQYQSEEQSLSQFQVASYVHITISDSHIASSDAKELHTQHFTDLCNDIALNCSNSDGLMVVGDVANSGSESEWKKAKSIIDSVSGMCNVYFALGNHDLFGGNYNTQISYFYIYADTDSVYYERVINGYHHIFLGSTTSSDGLNAYLSNEELIWLDNKLFECTLEDKTKPVFIYLHQSLYNTISGSLPGQGWHGVIQDEFLRSIISKYSQVVMFNGHSHWDMNSYGNMYKKNENLPTIFNTASVAYLWDSIYIPTGTYLKGSQAYYVEVYENYLLVRGKDIANKQWIPSAYYYVDLK